MKRPIVVFTLFWVLGVYFALVFRFNTSIAVLSLCLVMLVLYISHRKLPYKPWITCFLAMIISYAYTCIYDDLNRSELSDGLRKPQAVSGSEVRVKGSIHSNVEVDGDHVSFVMRVLELRWTDTKRVIELSENMQVHLRVLTVQEQSEARQWGRGDGVSLSGTIRAPSPARNFGGFDYKRYLRLKHIQWMVSVKGANQAIVSPMSAGWNTTRILRWNDEFRSFLGNQLDGLYSEEQAGFMKSLLIGLRDDLDPQQFQQFSQIGLTHVLAISGLHVAVFLAGCMGLFRLFGATRETNLLLGLILVPVYVILSGASPSVVRAGITAMIGLYAARRNLLKDGLHLLSIAGLLMLLWDPYYLLDVSFQLSFFVTLGLIVGVTRATKIIPVTNVLLNSSIAVNLVAQVVSFPLSIYYFNQFSLLSWFANLLLVPLLSFVVLPVGSVALIAGFFSINIGFWLAWVTERLNDFVFWTVDGLNRYDAFVTIWRSPTLLWISVYYLLIGTAVVGYGKWKDANGKQLDFLLIPGRTSRLTRWKYITIASFLCWIGIGLYGYVPNTNGEGEVQFLDVGQGDSMLIRTPSNRTILVDGGGTLQFRKPGEEWKNRRDPYEVGKKMLVPLLKKRGVQQIDYVIATHEDGDHIGGLYAVLEQIPVQHLIFNGTLDPHGKNAELYRIALRKNITLLAASSGKKLTVDRQTMLHFMNPDLTGGSRLTLDPEQNVHSVVFLMKMYRSTFLFTGDADFTAESDMLHELGGTEHQNIDVLKVGHHGSRTSTSEQWLDYWHPKVAIVSAGVNNFYGHPSDDVLDRLNERNISVFRTDLNGEIQVKINKDGMRLRTKLGIRSLQRN